MNLKVLSDTKDLRTGTNVIYAQTDINSYLKLVGEDFDRFGIQRKKEKHKGYIRLKSDLEKGALIPTITLAINPDNVNRYTPLIEEKKYEDVERLLKADVDNIYILDGLQRTYIINGIIKEEKNLEQNLLLEIWLEPNIDHLIYRLIVLNSGQKPMSMRHQLELLFMTMKSNLIKKIPSLKLIQENEEDRRSNANEFAFDRIVLAYKAFLMKSTEIDKNNVVSEKFMEDEILDSEEEFLSTNYDIFAKYLSKYCELDCLVFDKIYRDSINRHRNWLADTNVLISFFSSVGRFTNDPKKTFRTNEAINNLKNVLEESQPGDDPLRLKYMDQLKTEKADPKKYNVGFATRKLISSGFYEYFRSSGEESMESCWTISASEL
ncbi:hypothetical protein G5B30_00960 [Sphingobacterium sp. SGG-5]|uniref:hypothetical protein n=1 Tax=Sphingobacterium sp. SGG-5 TaxID=2710881 RepID=UPI0013EC3D29|nr:hypothetical protein [Sphingobacterium sp. SGG-5]NGM60474.1 hypothetical protein [Sphingobacterium sp. SGG-5]